MKTQLEVWNKDKVALLDIEKMRARKCSLPAGEIARMFADFVLNNMRGDVNDIVFDRIAANLLYDQPEINYHDARSRILTAFYHLSEREE